MSKPPTGQARQPAKKPNPLRGVVIALLVLLAIPKTREAVLTPLGVIVAAGVGVLITLTLWGLSSAKR